MSTAPRLDACIDAMLAKHSGSRYYEEAYQHLVPLARDLEREAQTLRAVLQDIMTERLIPAEYPLLMARVRAALDGGKNG